MRFLLISMTLLLALSHSIFAADRKIDFNRDIRPILSDNCFTCHGPDAGQRKADLRVDLRDGLLATVVPGKPEDSELFKRIISDDPEQRMPEKSSGKSLTKPQIDLLRDWIQQGAEWQGHWAWQPLKRPDVPRVENLPPGATEIDAFIRHRLAAEKLPSSPAADRVTLLRRITFDLTGLPPTPSEIDDFLKDQSPTAWEKVVDRLLSSPHYAERMAVFWLDLVRFADTIGYHSDNPRNIWPYRDYVIRSFQENKPFDQFTIEQLAGDLLPNATLQQKVASGYNRLLQTTEEGGSQPKEYIVKYDADRVRNLGSVWLGSTVGCAQCHDHKYDPYTQKDFYGLAAFFADVQELPVGRREPGMIVPTPEQQQQLSQLDQTLTSLNSQLNAETPELTAERPKWEESLRNSLSWTPLEIATFSTANKTEYKLEAENTLFAAASVAATETLILELKLPKSPVTAIRLEALADDRLPSQGPGASDNGNFVLSEIKARSKANDQSTDVPFAKVAADVAQTNFDAKLAIDGKTDLDTGWAILPHTAKNHELVVEFKSPLTADSLTLQLEFASRYPKHLIGKLRFAATSAASPIDSQLTPEFKLALNAPVDQRTPEQKSLIDKAFRNSTQLLADVRAKISQTQAQKDELLKHIPLTLVTNVEPRRTIRILKRGNWLDESGPTVTPQFPEFLSPPPSSAELSRLDLARWLVSRENPLTARVFVNRIWKLCFGAGLARSLEDIGTQGEWPTHPELLDWLAVDFQDSGWNVKSLIRKIVTSHTYQQSSLSSRELLAADPFNRLLARQSRYRLDAEFVRDNALAVSGLLIRTVGGPSVKPYQPRGYWTALNFPPREWENDSGESVYRRGMYTHWQRSFPYPSMIAFDATSREECTAERARSNIPQQALVLLNDPVYVEAARAFAENVLAQKLPSDADRIRFAFRSATTRTPSDAESAALIELLSKQRQTFTSDKDAAMKFLTIGLRPIPANIDQAELAAWTTLTRTLINLHETMTRE